MSMIPLSMSRLESIFSEKNVNEARNEVRTKLDSGQTPLSIHDELYPYVSYVTNSPYINPHLPKMHRICRNFYQYLTPNEAEALLLLETQEYVRRDKFPRPNQYRGIAHHSNEELIQAINDNDLDRVTNILSAIGFLEGKEELANRVLSLCSGFLDSTLGHSVSCTTFILQEYLDRKHESEWPTYAVLADYMCKGRFSKVPKYLSLSDPDTTITENLLRAVSGTGIESLHDAITIFAIQNSKQFVDNELYNHLVATWLQYLGEKRAEPIQIKELDQERRDLVDINDYDGFHRTFNLKDPEQLTAYAYEFIRDIRGRRSLAHFLIKCLIDEYSGQYNPHYLTGLGSLIWLINNYNDLTNVPKTALYQYFDFILK